MNEIDTFLNKIENDPGYQVKPGEIALANFYYSLYSRTLLEFLIEDILKEVHETKEERERVTKALKDKATKKVYDILASIAARPSSS